MATGLSMKKPVAIALSYAAKVLDIVLPSWSASRVAAAWPLSLASASPLCLTGTHSPWARFRVLYGSGRFR